MRLPSKYVDLYAWRLNLFAFLRLTVIPIETLMIYLYIQNFHLKNFSRRSDHKSQFSTTRLVRKFIHSLLSLDPDPSHAERLRATASLSKPETDFSLSYKDNKFTFLWADGLGRNLLKRIKTRKKLVITHSHFKSCFNQFRFSPILDYCGAVFHGCGRGNEKGLEYLECLQRRGGRIVLNTAHLSTEQMVTSLGWVSLTRRRENHIAKLHV